MKNNQTKILYLDGLRGVAALIVVIHHFTIAFFWGTYTAESKYYHYFFEKYIALTPLNLLIAGDFSVHVFFVLSAIVIARKFYKSNDYLELTKQIFKRYFRLAIPVSIVIVIVSIFLYFGWFYNSKTADFMGSGAWLKGFFNLVPNFNDMVSEIISSKVFLQDSNKFNLVFWTLGYELRGSMLVFLVAIVRNKFKYKTLLYTSLVSLFFGTYYLSFIFGLIILELMTIEKLPKINYRKPLGLILIGLTIYLGSNPTSGRWIYQAWSDFAILFTKETWMMSHSIAAGLLVLIVVTSEKLKYLLSTKSIVFLGKISFGVYLLHMIIFASLSCYITYRLMDSDMKYYTIFLVSIIPGIIVTFIAAYYFTMLDTWIVYKLKVITDKLFSID